MWKDKKDFRMHVTHAGSGQTHDYRHRLHDSSCEDVTTIWIHSINLPFPCVFRRDKQLYSKRHLLNPEQKSLCKNIWSLSPVSPVSDLHLQLALGCFDGPIKLLWNQLLQHAVWRWIYFSSTWMQLLYLRCATVGKLTPPWCVQRSLADSHLPPFVETHDGWETPP